MRDPVRRSRRGFSIIEMMVVITLISLLVGLLIPILSIAKRSSKESTTRNFLSLIQTATGLYEQDWGVFPPDGIATAIIAKKVGSGTYSAQSSGALYYSLCTPFRVTPSAARNEIAATKDLGPYLTCPPNRQFCASKISPPSSQTFFVDMWTLPNPTTTTAHTLQYNCIRDGAYGRVSSTAEGAPEIRETVTIVPAPSAAAVAAGLYCQNLNSYDLWSYGDGYIPGTLATCTRPLSNFKCKWE